MKEVLYGLLPTLTGFRETAGRLAMGLRGSVGAGGGGGGGAILGIMGVVCTVGGLMGGFGKFILTGRDTWFIIAVWCASGVVI